MEMDNNTYVDPDEKETKTQLTLYDIFIPTIGCAIIVVNFLIVISSGLVLKKNLKPKCTYMFLGNVALSDLLTGIAVLFGQFYPVNQRDARICSLELGLIVSSTLTSIYSVGLIAIDRFLYIVHGIKYQQWVYVRRARLLIFATWILGLVLGFLPLFGWSHDTEDGKFCWFILGYPPELIITIVCVAVLPLIVTLILYSIIFYSAIKQSHFKNSTTSSLRKFRGGNAVANLSAITGPNNNNSEKPTIKCLKTRPKCKALKIVGFTSLAVIVTWFPHFFASLYYISECQNINTKKCNSLRIVIASPLAILGFANSLINPIIYAWWHTGFRTFVKKRVSTIISRGRTLTSSTSQTTLRM